jgi:ubiquinone/menaquinone biosynthesis C-methylase UbiE
VHFIKAQELEGPNQHYERSYNRLAPFYTLFSKLAMLPFGGERKARGEILQHLDLNGGRTLEVSIGNGVNLPYLFESHQVGEVYGLDISAGMLKRCRKHTKRRGWEVDLFLAMAEGLPFKDETFDNVLHIGGINFFSDKGQAVKEMARVARPGGRVVIADEAERLAKGIDRSASEPPIPLEEGAQPGTSILKLVPGSMQDVRLEGIWKVHGKHHGYCVLFTKP